MDVSWPFGRPNERPAKLQPKANDFASVIIPGPLEILLCSDNSHFVVRGHTDDLERQLDT
jgi:hypothetical protein